MGIVLLSNPLEARMRKPNMNQPLKTGDRIRLVSMPMDPDPIPVGTLGTVLRTHDHGDWWQVEVAWDNERSLMLTMPEDCVELVDRKHQLNSH
jgi:L-ascorbate metabolism protein UlaG (beta-lactamase superfamily)